VAGLVLDRLGRIPAGGETVTVGDWLLEVLEVDRNTVERLRLRPRAGAPDG
jgi:putative hemolysin